MKHSWELNILSMLSPSRKARNHLKFHGELPHSESEQIYYYNKLTAEAALLFLRWLLLSETTELHAQTKGIPYPLNARISIFASSN